MSHEFSLFHPHKKNKRTISPSDSWTRKFEMRGKEQRGRMHESCRAYRSASGEKIFFLPGVRVFFTRFTQEPCFGKQKRSSICDLIFSLVKRCDNETLEPQWLSIQMFEWEITRLLVTGVGEGERRSFRTFIMSHKVEVKTLVKTSFSASLPSFISLPLC
jgi:hypothetical protein